MLGLFSFRFQVLNFELIGTQMKQVRLGGALIVTDFKQSYMEVFEVDCVEWRYTEALHLIGFRGSECLVCGFEF